jgi:Starch binding domain
VKKLLMLTFLASVTLFSANAQATIDWAGNAFPNNGHVTTPTGDQFVVAEVFKAGVTDGVGQGPDLSAVIQYQTDLMAAATTVAMNYNVDKGNNDEYLGNIPQAALAGAAYVDVTVLFTDAVDGSVFEITADQAGNVPLLRYTVSNVLPNDVAVTFTLCMSGIATAGAPCVIGGAPEIGSWGTGVTMNNVSGDLWDVTVIFLAGSNPSFEYKYKKDACATWEGTANRAVVLPTDGTTSVVLGTDSWEFNAIGCGLGNALDADRTLTFQVCLTGIDNTGGVCAIGNIPELTTWSTGVPLVNTVGALWEGSITIPAGTPIPVNVEYKFKKDDCATWESVPNRLITIDNASPAAQSLAHPWDEGLSDCFPVAVEFESFGTVKSKF